MIIPPSGFHQNLAHGSVAATFERFLVSQLNDNDNSKDYRNPVVCPYDDGNHGEEPSSGRED